jgi:cyanophycin synthetase
MKRKIFPPPLHKVKGTIHNKSGCGKATKLRHPLQQHTIQLPSPPAINLQAIDAWLQSALAVEIEPFVCPVGMEQSTRQAAVAGLLWRCLLLVRVFLQAANIPVFDPGIILSIQADSHDSNKWKAIIAIARIDHIDLRCYNLAIKSSINVLLGLMEKQLTQQNRAELYTLLEKKVIHPLKALVTAGKSTIPLLRAADDLDIPFIHLGEGVYQLGWGARAIKMDRSAIETDSAIGAKQSHNKVWSAHLLRMAGLPAPEHGVVVSVDEAIHTAHTLGWPVVVKPADLDRGEGVTVGISDDDALLKAFNSARKLSRQKQVIIERQVAGVCHRVFIANRRLLYVIKRLPKSIIGDGERSVAELIQMANSLENNSPPWLRSEYFPADAEAVAAMQAVGFTLDSIPGAGVPVPLRGIESTRDGGRFEDLTASIHPDNVAIALMAAELFGLCVVGVDIISADISRPWHENGAIINEVNFKPQLGRSEISRSYLPDFLSRFVVNDGRIPVEIYAGGDSAVTAARNRQKELLASSVQCYLTSHDHSVAPTGETIHFPFTTLFRRCRALLLNRQVEAIILVVQTDEFLHTGLPIDRASRVSPLSGPLLTLAMPHERLPQARINAVMALLNSIVASVN